MTSFCRAGVPSIALCSAHKHVFKWTVILQINFQMSREMVANGRQSFAIWFKEILMKSISRCSAETGTERRTGRKDFMHAYLDRLVAWVDTAGTRLVELGVDSENI